MKMLGTLLVIATLTSLAAAQDSRAIPPSTAQENTQAASTQPDIQPEMATTSSNPPFCPNKTCLYYAGDFDSNDSGAGALFNANDISAGLYGATWVGLRPPKAATVTGATFNELFTAGFTGVNPAPFQTRIGITTGSAGTLVCNTSGNATLTLYGESDFGLTQYSFTVKKLAKACKIAKPSKKYPSTYVNLQPQSDDGHGYTANVEDAKPQHHFGWKNDLDDCYFNATDFGVNWGACNTQGTFDELSIALTGKNTN
jgi:hypothetical protein